MKIYSVLSVLLFALVLAACDDLLPVESRRVESPKKITFAEVSDPYRDRYGSPEDINKFDSDDYHIVDWWWWTKGYMVSFQDTPYDDAYGWAVGSTYSFSPIP